MRPARALRITPRALHIFLSSSGLRPFASNATMPEPAIPLAATCDRDAGPRKAVAQTVGDVQQALGHFHRAHVDHHSQALRKAGDRHQAVRTSLVPACVGLQIEGRIRKVARMAERCSNQRQWVQQTKMLLA